MGFDFDDYEKGSGHDFKKACKKVPEDLDSDETRRFYDISLKLLNDGDIDIDNKHCVLIAICKALSKHDYLDDFVSGGYLAHLPYGEGSLREQLFDLFYPIAQHAPHALQGEIVEKFASLISAAPRKALAVLTVYAKNFETAKKANWQPMLDLLVEPKSAQYFRVRLYCKDYVSLLVYLCQKFPAYRSERITKCWDAICAALTVKRDETLCLCYYALCTLYEQNPSTIANCKFPSQAVAVHLRRQHVQQAALSLLYRVQPNGEATDVINSLVWAAHTEINAMYVLVKMASDVSVAHSLIRDAAWMVQELPTKVDTMRIFAVVLSHQKLREELATKNECLAFLRSAIELNTPGVLSAITTFIRRLPLTQAYVQRISDFGLISTFFGVAHNRKDQKSVHSTLLFIDTFAKVAYTRDLVYACEYLANLIKAEDAMSFQAAKVACDLAKYPKCAVRFQQLQLDKYFFQHQKDSRLKKAAIHFLKAMKHAYQNEVNAQLASKKSAPATPVRSIDKRPNEPARGDRPPKRDSSSSSSSDETKHRAAPPPTQPKSSSSSSEERPSPPPTKISSSSSSEKIPPPAPHKSSSSDNEKVSPPQKSSSSDDEKIPPPPPHKSSSSDNEKIPPPHKSSSSDDEKVPPPHKSSSSSDDEKIPPPPPNKSSSDDESTSKAPAPLVKPESDSSSRIDSESNDKKIFSSSSSSSEDSSKPSSPRSHPPVHSGAPRKGPKE